MRPFDDPVSMTPDQRDAAVAIILADGIPRTRDALREELFPSVAERSDKRVTGKVVLHRFLH